MPTALARWEQRTEWPLAGVACCFLAAYSVQVLVRPVGIFAETTEAVILASWAAFGADFVVRLCLAERRGRWGLRHLHELAIIALPVLRPLRLLRLVTLVAVLLIYVASLAMLDGARPRRSHTDVSRRPVVSGHHHHDRRLRRLHAGHPTGRCVAVALMLGGIGLIGVVTATLASWIVRRVSEEEDAQLATKAQIQDLLREVRDLREQVRDLEGSPLCEQSRTR